MTFALSSLSTFNNLSPQDFDDICLAHTNSSNQRLPTHLLPYSTMLAVDLHVHIILDGMEHSCLMTFFVSNGISKSTIGGQSDVGASLILEIARRKHFGAFTAGTTMRESQNHLIFRPPDIVTYPVIYHLVPREPGETSPPSSIAARVYRSVNSGKVPVCLELSGSDETYDCYFDSSIMINSCPLKCMSAAKSTMSLTDGSDISIFPTGRVLTSRLDGNSLYQLSITLTNFTDSSRPQLLGHTTTPQRFTGYFLALHISYITLAFPGPIKIRKMIECPVGSLRIFTSPNYHGLSAIYHRQLSNNVEIPWDINEYTARLVDCHPSHYHDITYADSSTSLSWQSYEKIQSVSSPPISCPSKPMLSGMPKNSTMKESFSSKTD